MSVHYKFKSTLDVDTIKFDGLHISVADLKRAIIQQKRLGKITDFDLQITNAQTREVYWEDTTLIPKNTSLIVARVPLVHHQKKSFDNQADAVPQQSRSTSKAEGISVDIFKMKGTEEDKIAEMMMQSTADYDPNSYVKIKGQTQTGDVPATYRCNKCKKGGHWIKNCTFAGGKLNSDVKRNTGIPKSFLEKDDKAMENEKEEAAIVATPPNSLPIPEELLCSICNDLFIDAVMIPCCGSSFCDDCVRSALLDSDENECPDCKEKGCSPASLIPNRFLRNSVNIFKTETGYKKASVKMVPKSNDNSNLNKEPDTQPNAGSSEPSETGSKSLKPNVPAPSEQSDTAKEDKKETSAATKATIPSSHSTQTHTNTRSTNESKQVVPTMEEHHKNNAKKPMDVSRVNVTKKPQEMYRGPDCMSSYQQIPTHTQMRQDHPPHCQPPQQVPFHSLYNEPRHIESIRYPNFNPMPYYHNTANPYMPERQHHVDLLMQAKPAENLSSIFQSVEQKVGTGIIDDPLEAFNRIMKEKERRRRRSPEITRQRSRNAGRDSPRYSRRSVTRESRNHNYRKENVSRYAKPSREKNNRRRSNSPSDRSPRNSKSREANKQGGGSLKKRSISPLAEGRKDAVKRSDHHSEDKRFDHSAGPLRDTRKDPENSDATNRKLLVKETTPLPAFDSANAKASNHDSKRSSPMTPPLRFNQDCNGKEDAVESRNKRPVSVLRDCKSPKAKIRRYSPSPDRKSSHWDHHSDKDSRTLVNQENTHKKSSQNGGNSESLESDALKPEHSADDPNDSNVDKKSKTGKKRRKEKDDRKKVKKHKRDKEKKVKESSFTKKDEKRKSKDDCSILKQSNENEFARSQANPTDSGDGELPCPQSDDKSGDHRHTSRQSSVTNDVGSGKNLDDELLFDRISSDPFASKSDNPIFTRAINAIRPSDKPKDVMDSSENSSCISGRNTFEITVPRQDSKERSVKAVKSDYKDRHGSRKTTGMSIKDRLGTKRLSPHSKTGSNDRSSRRSRERTADKHKSGSMSNKNEFSYKPNADKAFNSVSEQNDRHSRKDATHNYGRISSVCVENRGKREGTRERERNKSYRHSKERDSSENRKDNSKNRKVRKSPKKKKDKKLKRRK